MRADSCSDADDDDPDRSADAIRIPVEDDPVSSSPSSFEYVYIGFELYVSITGGNDEKKSTSSIYFLI